MARIAIVDLSFTWPPDGGARTDVREIAVRLARTHDVMLFVPWIEGWLTRTPLNRTRFFWKGKISADVGIPFTRIPFGPVSFGAGEVGERFRREVEKWKPDHVWIADGWYLKPYVALALKEFRPVMRIYAHEMLCLKGNGFLFRWGKPCDKDYLSGTKLTHARCTLCTSSFYLTYPSPTWIHEFLTSRAFLPSYPEKVIEAFEAVRSVIVYNEFTARRIRPFCRDVRVIPSGVDTERFRPLPSGPRPGNGKKIILAMGRTEEPRKGVSVLLEAGRKLHRSRDDFEIWLTDSGTSPEPWVSHVGWKSFDEMPSLYHSVDLAVVPSLWPEPHGIVALEAMACGCPTLVSRIGGLTEIGRLTGEDLSFDPGNVTELAARLGDLLDHPEKRRDLADRGRKAVETRYRWDAIVRDEMEPCLLNGKS